MRIERNSLIAITLLFMAGCAASRQARQAENFSSNTDPVKMPIRHADEYDLDAGNYQYEAAPENDDTLPSSQIRKPSQVPLHEPIPAPPAIGVSRVKRVSQQQDADHRPEHNNYGDDSCGDGYKIGQQTHFPPVYFGEGCVTSSSPCQETTTLKKFAQGWNLRAKPHRRSRLESTYDCRKGLACEPGFILPEGCSSTFPRARSNRDARSSVKQYIGGALVEPRTAPHANYGGSLADPLQENSWDEQAGAENPHSSSAEMLDLPSTLETLTQSQPSQHVPNVPVIEAAPAIPLPEAQPELSPAPSIQLPEAPPKIPQQVDPSAVNRILRPPMWPRLGSTAGTYRSAPVAASPDGDDAALPVIQPGRKI